jgi:hypothetical protein
MHSAKFRVIQYETEAISASNAAHSCHLCVVHALERRSNGAHARRHMNSTCNIFLFDILSLRNVRLHCCVKEYVTILKASSLMIKIINIKPKCPLTEISLKRLPGLG